MFALAPHHREVAPPSGIITDGLIDLWDYSEQSGSVIGGMNGNDAVLGNSTFNGWGTEADPRYQNYYEFNGNNEYALTPTITHGDLPDWSLVTWVNILSAVAFYDAIIQHSTNHVGQPGLYADTGGNGEWGIYWANAFSSGLALPVGTWTFIVMTGNKTGGANPGTANIDYYQNAVKTPNTNSAGTREMTDYPIRLGARSASQGTHCRMAMTRFYDRVITQAEIDQMYAGTG